MYAACVSPRYIILAAGRRRSSLVASFPLVSKHYVQSIVSHQAPIRDYLCLHIAPAVTDVFRVLPLRYTEQRNLQH